VVPVKSGRVVLLCSIKKVLNCALNVSVYKLGMCSFSTVIASELVKNKT